MSSNTPIIKLLKKDPTIDANDTFNIKTMLNDNWDKIDEAFGDLDASQITIEDSANYFASTEVEGALHEIGYSLSERTRELTNPVGKTATINSGTQVIQGGVAPAIALPKATGRTLINPLGDAGNCETLAGWYFSATTGALDTSNKVLGNNGIKITLTSATGTMYRTHSKISAGKKYLALAEIKNGNATSAILRFASNGGTPGVGAIFNTTKFSTAWTKIAPSADIDSPLIDVLIGGVSGQYVYVDGFRVYEVSAAEYTALDSMTSDQIAAKYPYVGTGIHGVKDATIISVQDNMLPPFSEWALHANAKIVNPYEIKITPTAIDQSSHISIPIIKGETYTFSTELIGSGIDGVYKGSFNAIGAAVGYTFTVDDSFNGYVTIFVSNATVSEATIKNPILIKGSLAQPFKPQSRTSLTAYTELHSNTDGTIKDTLEYVNGKPKKLKRFGKIVLDGSLAWTYAASLSGYKMIALLGLPAGTGYLDLSVTKYDGRPLSPVSSATAADQTYLIVASSHKDLILTISNVDSGWGDAYTPTAAEIKAYFSGYKMAHIDGTPYLTGTKYWNKRYAGIGMPKTYPDGTVLVDGWVTLTVPSELNEGFTPYQLLYQLATPITEAVQTSGAVVLESGDNYVTATSTNVPMLPSTLTYANSFYSALNDAERAIAANSEAGALLLGGMKPERFIFGENKTGATYWDKGVDNIVKSGYYYVGGNLTGLPIVTNGYVMHESYTGEDSAFYTQTFTPYDSDRRFFRRKINGVTQPWVELYTSGSASRIPLQTTANLTYYVNAATGSDTNNGLTDVTPFKTIQKAIKLIPQVLNHAHIIYVAAGTYTEIVDVSGFMGKGSLNILGATAATTTHNVTNISVVHCTAPIVIRGFNTTTAGTGVYGRGCICLSIYAISCITAGPGTIGIYLDCCAASIETSTISNKNTAIYVIRQSTVTSESNTGSGNSVGLYAYGTSTIGKAGSQPSGTVAESISAGGVIR